MVATTNSTGAAQTSQSRSDKARSTLGSNFSTFLTLLTKQLQNQDPMAPMDTSQFTNQLVQYANVEQTIGVNSNLEKLIDFQQKSQMGTAVSYVGLEVDLNGNKVPLVDQNASFSYTLGDNATETRILIFDDNNQLVRAVTYEEGEGENLKGEHSFAWDGKDDNGLQRPDGVYRIAVTALGSDEKIVATTLKPRGIVTGVMVDGDKTTLDVSGVQMSLNDVTTVRIPGVTGTSTPTNI